MAKVEQILNEIKENRIVSRKLLNCCGVSVWHSGDGGVDPIDVKYLAKSYLKMTGDIIEVIDDD